MIRQLRKFVVLVFGCLTVLVGCDKEFHYSPSVVELMLTGDKYAGRIVDVSGYMGRLLGGETAYYLYANTDEERMKNRRMGLLVLPSLAEEFEGCLGKFIRISGTYEANDMAELVGQKYALTAITYAHEIPEDMSLTQSERDKLVCYEVE